MRTPNQYLAPAFARLQGGPLRDCSETMRWGGRTGTVSRVGSPRRGEDTVLDSDIPEECRVLAPTVPFCGLARGDAVELGDTFRVVTSATDNITRSAFFTVGLSAAFDMCRAAYPIPGLAGSRAESARSGCRSTCLRSRRRTSRSTATRPRNPFPRRGLCASQPTNGRRLRRRRQATSWSSSLHAPWRRSASTSRPSSITAATGCFAFVQGEARDDRGIVQHRRGGAGPP